MLLIRSQKNLKHTAACEVVGVLPCDEKVRCVKHNCPNVNVTCEDSKYDFFKDEEKAFTVNPHKKILCQKGCDDVLKNSVEYENCVKRNCPSAKFMQE